MSERYIPERSDIIWLDFEPKKGKEIGKYRPVLVLSSKEYQRETGLVICCPISSSIRGKNTEVPIEGLSEPSVVAASLVQTVSWKTRKAKKIGRAKRSTVDQVLLRLLPLIGAEPLIRKMISS